MPVLIPGVGRVLFGEYSGQNFEVKMTYEEKIQTMPIGVPFTGIDMDIKSPLLASISKLIRAEVIKHPDIFTYAVNVNIMAFVPCSAVDRLTHAPSDVENA